jgi:hypothetical protein
MIVAKTIAIIKIKAAPDGAAHGVGGSSPPDGANTKKPRTASILGKSGALPR